MFACKLWLKKGPAMLATAALLLAVMATGASSSQSAPVLAPGVDTLVLQAGRLVHLLTGESAEVGGGIQLAFAPSGHGVLTGDGAEAVWAQSRLQLAVVGEGSDMLLVKHRRTEREESIALQAWWQEHSMRKVVCSLGTRTFPTFDAAFFPNSISGACNWCAH